jgi:hypothetical protein
LDQENTMALKDQITEDMKTAMRAKDSARLGTIRLLLAACKQKEVDERVTLDDAAVTAIIDKLVKQRKDSIAAFTTAQRQDLVDKEAPNWPCWRPTCRSAWTPPGAVRSTPSWHPGRRTRPQAGCRRHGPRHGPGQDLASPAWPGVCSCQGRAGRLTLHAGRTRWRAQGTGYGPCSGRRRESGTGLVLSSKSSFSRYSPAGGDNQTSVWPLTELHDRIRALGHRHTVNLKWPVSFCFCARGAPHSGRRMELHPKRRLDTVAGDQHAECPS